MDVALNNYSQYASKGRVSNKSHRKHSSQHQQNINNQILQQHQLAQETLAIKAQNQNEYKGELDK